MTPRTTPPKRRKDYFFRIARRCDVFAITDMSEDELLDSCVCMKDATCPYCAERASRERTFAKPAQTVAEFKREKPREFGLVYSSDYRGYVVCGSHKDIGLIRVLEVTPARLAAEELLEALEDLIKMRDGKLGGDLWAQAEAAIAKARGQHG